jgi:hypothetical protein
MFSILSSLLTMFTMGGVASVFASFEEEEEEKEREDTLLLLLLLLV